MKTMTKKAIALMGTFALTGAAFAAALAPGEREIPQSQGTRTNPNGDDILITTKCVRLNGEPTVGVMGEMHFSRVPAAEWRDYVQKMKAGGLGYLATYVFWNHHEETEGEFNFSGQRDLSAFLSVCDEEKMPVVLRVGPWCHGEVRNGGFPDWLCEKCDSKALRSVDEGFMVAVERWWRAMFPHVEKHLWKNGGFVVGVQIENECRGPWKYFQRLKDLAREIGFDVPFYTRTGWPAMRDTPAYGELLPLFGDYVDGHWGRLPEISPGRFSEIWKFSSVRSSENIATEMIAKNLLGKDEAAVAEYPFLTCELGGGMSCAYHRRVEVWPRDTYSLALLKLGCGSNLIGYYMYASGTNPSDGKTFLNECQTSPYTFNNDLPPLSYEYQSPISEYGRLTETYYLLQPLHRFCREFGRDFALEAPEFIDEHHARRGPFHFYCDYNRKTNTSGRAYILPENWTTKKGTIKSATAQPVGWDDDVLVMMKVPGLEPKVEFADEPFEVKFIEHASDTMGAKTAHEITIPAITPVKLKEAGKPREIAVGNGKVALAPTEEDWGAAAEWSISVPKDCENDMLEIEWQGDAARLYIDDKLVADQYYCGKPFVCGLWRHKLSRNSKVVFKVLPWGDSPLVYIQPPMRLKEKNAAIVAARFLER